MRIRRNRQNWFVLLGIFVAVFLFAFLVQRFNSGDDAEAANMAGFDPGYIMSDYQMGNYTSMGEAQIQAFLKSKNACNDTRTYLTGNNVGHLSESTPYSWHVAGGHYVCMADENFNGESAAHIIWQAAQDYRINPQVLIVLLQKEQGLVTDTLPNSVQYRSATGYGCPDTAACSSKYYGFKNQVRNAAALFRSVLDGGWTNYPLGNNYVRYNPNAACGGTTVNIRSLATSALYRYTPYQPNAAALSSSYGGGDGCSAYGNRNFYSYFEDWFGDITGGKLAIPESNYVVEGEYTIQSAIDSGKMLDVAGGSAANGANMQIFQANGSAAQWWVITRNSDNTYMIKNAVSGKVLDVAGGGIWDGTNVQTHAWNATCAQKWNIVRNGDGSMTVYSACSGRVLDVAGGSSANGANVQIFQPNGSAAQKWYFKTGRVLADGEYKITSNVANNMVVDVAGGVGNAKDATNIQMYSSNNSSAQKWKLTYGADGYYTIANSEARKVLDVAGGSVANDANVQLHSANRACAQKWQIVKNSSGDMTIYSACSGLALDVTGGSSANGANVQIHDYNGTAAQRWRFELVQDVVDGRYYIQSAINNSKVLDVAGGSSANGANVQIYRSNSTNAQKWQIQATGDGYYTIKNPSSGKVLDVAGGKTANGTNVQLFESNKSCAQKWQMVKDDNDNYKIYSACSGVALDVAAGIGADGVNVQIFSFNGTVAQRWKLVNY